VGYLTVTRVAAVLPGYATVARASEVLHLAPRSVRDLIYAGRLPSLRIGRLHYVRAGDLELERRRRLGLRPPARRPRTSRPRSSTRTTAPERRPVDPALRGQRAIQRAADVSRWAERHHPTQPQVPFATAIAVEGAACAICGRELRVGARVVASGQERLCLACGRRALLDWADRRRQEAAAARRLAQDLSAPRDAAQANRVA
jgi:hypothetical protein